MSEKGKIIVKKEAFRNMLTHVLRFGNESLEISVEVMGICLGKIASNGKDIVLSNAIPITHGDKASKEFSTEDIAIFEKIEKEYAKQNLHIVGSYISSPGRGLFFSEIAIRNHRYFQKEQKPYGFCIVFDHTLMGKDGNLGFEIYRLNNFKEGKEYYKVVYEVEIPDTLDYFKWIQKFVEDTEKREPILIKEINELIKPISEDLQEIPKPESFTMEEEKEKYPDITSIISGFEERISKFTETFLDIFKSQLSSWTINVKNRALIGSNSIKDSISQMKDKMSFGMSKIENWFEKNLINIANNFKENVSTYVDNQIGAQKELINYISKSKADIINTLSYFIEDNFKKMDNKMENKVKEISEKINKNIQINSKMEELVNNFLEKIQIISNETNKISTNINEDITTISLELKQEITNGIENISKELKNVKESRSQMNNTLQKLQKTIKSLQKL